MRISKGILFLLVAPAHIPIVVAQDFGAGTDLYPNNIEIGAGPLHWAAAENDVEQMQRLLESGVSADDRAELSMSTPLHFAARDGRYEAAELLLEHGADVHARNESVRGKRSFDELVGEYDLLTAVRLLMDGGGYTPLHFAVRSGHYDVAVLLLDNGADVDARDWSGATPLGDFTCTGELNVSKALSIADLLIDRGAEINATSEGGWTPLHNAVGSGCAAGDPEVIAFLIANGADVNVRTEDGVTALHTAALEGELAAAELLIANGADVNARNARGETPLGIAEGRSVRRLLREHGAVR